MKKKRCPECGETKSIKDFYRNRRNKDGYAFYCKQCSKLKNRKWLEDHPRATFRKRIKAKYGLTIEQYGAMWQAQNGRCTICTRPIEPGHAPNMEARSQYACVDHNHITGSVRSLLCRCCNLGLGYFADSPANLERAAEYLRGHEE